MDKSYSIQDETIEPNKKNFLAYNIVARMCLPVATVASVLAMVFHKNMLVYYLRSCLGGMLDWYNIKYVRIVFENEQCSLNYDHMITIVKLATVIASIISLITVIDLKNPYDKPNIKLNITSFVLSVVALILYIVSSNYMLDKVMRIYSETNGTFGIYHCLLIALIANCLLLLINLLASLVENKRWKENEWYIRNVKYGSDN